MNYITLVTTCMTMLYISEYRILFDTKSYINLVREHGTVQSGHAQR